VPNRYVRESAIESESVEKLSWQAEVFWRRLLNRVDDFGRFTANPELLRASLFPLRLNKVSAADIGKMLLECEHADLVSTWKGDGGKAYLVLHKWEKGRAKESKYPVPPDAICLRLQTDVNGCLQTQTNAPDPDYDYDYDHDSDPDNDKSRSQNGEEKKKRKHSFEKSPYFDFEKFREAFPTWPEPKARKYWESALGYSKANGGRYLDWAMAVANWARKDEQKSSGPSWRPSEKTERGSREYPESITL
jgi:hypothetical protein